MIEPRTICVDYDGTFSIIPGLLTSFIISAKKAGHHVICATMQYKDEGDEVEKTIGKLCEIFYTGRQAKLSYLQELNIVPDIWIDDQPQFILMDASDKRE